MAAKRKPKNSKFVMVSLRISPTDLRALKTQAKKFADGSFSAWLRHAGLRYIPKRGEVVYETVATPPKKKR